MISDKIVNWENGGLVDLGFEISDFGFRMSDMI